MFFTLFVMSTIGVTMNLFMESTTCYYCVLTKFNPCICKIWFYFMIWLSVYVIWKSRLVISSTILLCSHYMKSSQPYLQFHQILISFILSMGILILGLT